MSAHFDILNSYYDKIYVLSLSRLEDRISYITSVCKGLNFEFFWGTDKLTNSLEDLEKKDLFNAERHRALYKHNKNINLGMLCCSIGHLNIYKDIVQNGYQRTLILEDDAIPVIENFFHFPDIVNELPADWELFYLGYEKNDLYGWKAILKKLFYKVFPPHSNFRLTPEIISNYYPVALSPQIAIAGFHDCTHAYCVTLKGAEKLLAMQTPVAFHPDNLLSYMICNENLNGYICRHRLFNQRTAFKDSLSSLTSS